MGEFASTCRANVDTELSLFRLSNTQQQPSLTSALFPTENTFADFAPGFFQSTTAAVLCGFRKAGDEMFASEKRSAGTANSGCKSSKTTFVAHKTSEISTRSGSEEGGGVSWHISQELN